MLCRGRNSKLNESSRKLLSPESKYQPISFSLTCPELQWFPSLSYLDILPEIGPEGFHVQSRCYLGPLAKHESKAPVLMALNQGLL